MRCIKEKEEEKTIDIKDLLAAYHLYRDYQAQWAVTLLKVLFYPEELPGYSRFVL